MFIKYVCEIAKPSAVMRWAWKSSYTRVRYGTTKFPLSWFGLSAFATENAFWMFFARISLCFIILAKGDLDPFSAPVWECCHSTTVESQGWIGVVQFSLAFSSHQRRPLKKLLFSNLNTFLLVNRFCFYVTFNSWHVAYGKYQAFITFDFWGAI